MRRVALAAAAAAVVLVGAAGCRETVWPSDADQQDFCAAVTGPSFTEGDYDELAQLGTPANLPYEARRHLLDLAEGDDTDPEREAAFASYVEDYCGS